MEWKGGEGENDLTHPCRKFLATPLTTPATATAAAAATTTTTTTIP